jgi:hypothetical protein
MEALVAPQDNVETIFTLLFPLVGPERNWRRRMMTIRNAMLMDLKGVSILFRWA